MRSAAAWVVGCVALAGLTLLGPSAPTYDPWSWIIWGREIAHFDLVTTGGPSWKPLPVVFTTVFSLFGSWAPDLWLVVARAGAIAAVVPGLPRLATARRRDRRRGRCRGRLAIAPWWIRNAALGNSEGLIVAFLLATIDRHLAGDRRGRRSCWRSAPGCCGPRHGRSWASTGSGCCGGRELPARLIIGAGCRRRRALAAAGVVGLGRPAARRPPRQGRQPGRADLRRQPGPGRARGRERDAHRPAGGGPRRGGGHGDRAPRPRGRVPRRAWRSAGWGSSPT